MSYTADEAAGWLRQHADVLFDISPDGRLIQTNEPDPEPPPRVFLARGLQLAEVWFSGDVPDETIRACRAIVDALPTWNGEPSDPTVYHPLREALCNHGPIGSETSGPAFRFPERVATVDKSEAVVIDERSVHLLERYFPYTLSVLARRSPVVGVVRGGAVVSACYAARRRPSAAEAGVDTELAFRGQRLASAVVAGWAMAARSSGLMPLYSTTWDNIASRNVAARLGLIAYAETVALS